MRGGVEDRRTQTRALSRRAGFVLARFVLRQLRRRQGLFCDWRKAKARVELQALHENFTTPVVFTGSAARRPL